MTRCAQIFFSGFFILFGCLSAHGQAPVTNVLDRLGVSPTNVPPKKASMLRDRSHWPTTKDGKLKAPLKEIKQPKVSVPQLKPEEPIITVNGEVLTWGAMKRYADLMVADFRLPAGVTAEDFEGEKDRILMNYVFTIAEHFITKTVLAQEARRHQLVLTADEVSAKRKALMSISKGATKSEDGFRKELDTPGSFATIDLTNMLLTAKLTKEVVRPSVHVTEEDINQFLAQREAKNRELTAFNDNLRPRAESIIKRIKAGESFGELAAVESDCESRDKNGEFGTFKRGDIRPELYDTAFKLEEGAISDAVETPYSFHILKLIKKNRGYLAEGDKGEAPVISLKIAHIMLEKKELLPVLDRSAAKAALLVTHEKEAVAKLKERLIKEAKIVTPLPLY